MRHNEIGDDQHDDRVGTPRRRRTAHGRGGLRVYRRPEKADRPEQSLSGHPAGRLSPADASDAGDFPVV